MTRTTKLAALVLTLLAVPAFACAGWLVNSEFLIGAMACTYRLSDGSLVRVIYPNAGSCPPCME